MKKPAVDMMRYPPMKPAQVKLIFYSWGRKTKKTKSIALKLFAIQIHP